MNNVVDGFTAKKFDSDSITHILPEINFWDFGSAKFAILTHLMGLNFDFLNFCTFSRLKFTK